MAILLLNRHTQRAAIGMELRKTVIGKDHRVLFAPVCAEAGNQIERFPEQLLSTLETGEGLTGVAKIQSIQLDWPHKGLTWTVANLEQSLTKRLDSEPDRDLKKILADYRPSAPPGQGSVLMFHWPVLAQWPSANDLCH